MFSEIIKYLSMMGKTERPENLYKVMSLICLLAGLAFLTATAISYHKYSDILQRGIRTTGAVISCSIENQNVPSVSISKWSLGKPITYNTKCYQYRIEFETVYGQKIDFSVGENDDRPLKISDKVTVLYLSAAPESSAIIDYGPNFAFFYFGLFLTGLSSLYYFKLI